MVNISLSFNFTLKLFFQFENSFNFDSNIFGKTCNSHCTSSTNPIIGAKYLNKKLTATINNIWMTGKIGSCIHHSKYFYYSLHPV